MFIFQLWLAFLHDKRCIRVVLSLMMPFLETGFGISGFRLEVVGFIVFRNGKP